MYDQTLKRIFILLVLATLGWLLYLLLPVLIPFLSAFLLAYLFSAPVQRMQNAGMPRWVAISSVFLLIGIGLALAGWFLLPMIWKQLVYARDHIPEALRFINKSILPWLSDKFNVHISQLRVDELNKSAMDYLQNNYNMSTIQDTVLTLARSGLNFIQVGGTAILVPIIAFYFLLDWNNMLVQLRRLIPRPIETKTVQIVQECHNVLGAFVKGQFLVMLLLGVIYAVGLQLIGIEVGIIIGLVAGLASIIPYLGFATGIVAAVIASLLQYGMDWTHLALVGVVFFIGQLIEGYVLQPFLLGDKIGLSPVAVVFAVLAGAQLLGFAGMLIALPLAAVIVVLLGHLRESYEHSRLYGGHAFSLPTDTIVLSDPEATQEPLIVAEKAAKEDVHQTKSEP